MPGRRWTCWTGDVTSLRVELIPPNTASCRGGLCGRRRDPCLVGTQVHLSASEQTLRAAVVCLEGGGRIPPGSRRTLAALRRPWLHRGEVRAYWFALVIATAAGRRREPLEIRAVPDSLPVWPSSSRRPLWTSRGGVCVGAGAKDDLALRRVSLVMTRSDQPRRRDGRPGVYPPPSGETEKRITAHPLSRSRRRGAGRAPRGITAGAQALGFGRRHRYFWGWRPTRTISPDGRAAALTVITAAELRDRLAARRT